MSRQDKATTERNARVLRELVKQPDNKSCSDCRKNDARWASWNLGVFLCIRCSGIHRSMGTHISKVKSIDLDIWTPEQMENIQKWGNRRANAYWEKHLKKGHVPPEHKIESFIRSKYESRRWAMEGPIPQDPRVLDEDGGGGMDAPQPTSTSSAAPPAPASLPKSHPLLSRQTVAAAPKAIPAIAASTSAPLFDLMGGDDPAPPPAPAPTRVPVATTTPAPAAPAATTGAAAPGPTAAPTQAQGGSNIFDLDFRAPTPSSRNTSAKADIMSLFSSTSPTTTAPASGGFFNATPAPSNGGFGSWQGGITSSAPPAAAATNQVSTAGWGGLQMDSGGWGAPVTAPAAAPPQQPSQPVEPQRQPSFGASTWGADPWAAPANPQAGMMNGGMAAKKEKDDPFANIWQ